MRFRLGIGIICLILSLNVRGQTKYWIFLQNNTSIGDSVMGFSVENLHKNDSLNLSLAAYKDSIEHIIGHPCITRSKWLFALSTYATPCQIDQLSLKPWIKEIIPIRGYMPKAEVQAAYLPENFGIALKQIGIDAILEQNISGKNVKIGVIDAGFFEANKSQDLKQLMGQKRIMAIKDYQTQNRLDHFSEAETDLDFHGTTVIKHIVGYDSTTKTLSGFAPSAQLYLARTDHGRNEYRGEEDLWVSALEWMDSLGVKLINTSLGYATGFSDPKENYRPDEINGTSVIAKAAEIAVKNKGMILVVSAGNDGAKQDWRIISTPADAEDVIAVGATKQNIWEKMNYSGIGPEFLPYVKPDLACYSATGTSFSAPIITGLIACMLELKPSIQSNQVKEILQQSAHLYPFPNNYVGYGVPQADRILQLLKSPSQTLDHFSTVVTTKNTFELKKSKTSEDAILVYHKKNDFIVLQTEIVRKMGNKFLIQKPKNAKRSTLDLKNKIIEIYWN